jgi:hypothetical protein
MQFWRSFKKNYGGSPGNFLPPFGWYREIRGRTGVNELFGGPKIN